MGKDRQSRRAYWLDHVGRWRASGQSQVVYCAQHQLKLASFAYWIKREKAQPAQAALTLVPVRIGAPAVSGEISLRGPGGWQLGVPAGVSAQWLGELLRALA